MPAPTGSGRTRSPAPGATPRRSRTASWPSCSTSTPERRSSSIHPRRPQSTSAKRASTPRAARRSPIWSGACTATSSAPSRATSGRTTGSRPNRGGGAVVVAGTGGGLTRCVGWRTANARRFVATDSFPVTAPLREGSLVLPPVADYLKPVGGPGDEARRRWRGGEVEENECETLGFVAQDTLLRLGAGRPAAGGPPGPGRGGRGGGGGGGPVDRPHRRGAAPRARGGGRAAPGRAARLARGARARAPPRRRPQRRAPAAAHHHRTRRPRARARGRPSRGGRVGGASPAADASRILEALQRVVLGQEAATREALVCLLARGHVLLEGGPGTAKTLLVRTLALALDVKFQRVQFTPDLMPADITGVTLLTGTHEFIFRPGPIFADLVLADEIDRKSTRLNSSHDQI